jgi:Tfp pilus assembly protein PilF
MSAEPYDGRGLSYLALGDAKNALDDFNEAVKRDRSSFQAWTNQGLALEQLGDRQKAFAAFARASSLNPNYQPAKDGMRRTSASG